MLTNEELTYPRYKVLVDYPGSDYHVGQVVVFNHKESWFTGQPEWTSEPFISKNGGRIQICIKNIENYSQVFQLLKWYEERTQDEMPLYIKYKDNGNAYIERLIAHNFDADPKPHFKTRRVPAGLYYQNTEAEPATKQEYLKYNNKTHKLFIPRYKAIKDYPYSPFQVGDVINNPPTKEKRLFEEYKEFFERLAWWELREENEIPNFLRSTKSDEIFKTLSSEPDQVYIENILGATTWTTYDNLEPATQDDWEDYKDSIKFVNFDMK